MLSTHIYSILPVKLKVPASSPPQSNAQDTQEQAFNHYEPKFTGKQQKDRFERQSQTSAPTPGTGVRTRAMGLLAADNTEGKTRPKTSARSKKQAVASQTATSAHKMRTRSSGISADSAKEETKPTITPENQEAIETPTLIVTTETTPTEAAGVKTKSARVKQAKPASPIKTLAATRPRRNQENQNPTAALQSPDIQSPPKRLTRSQQVSKTLDTESPATQDTNPISQEAHPKASTTPMDVSETDNEPQDIAPVAEKPIQSAPTPKRVLRHLPTRKARPKAIEASPESETEDDDIVVRDKKQPNLLPTKAEKPSRLTRKRKAKTQDLDLTDFDANNKVTIPTHLKKRKAPAAPALVESDVEDNVRRSGRSTEKRTKFHAALAALNDIDPEDVSFERFRQNSSQPESDADYTDRSVAADISMESDAELTADEETIITPLHDLIDNTLDQFPDDWSPDMERYRSEINKPNPKELQQTPVAYAAKLGKRRMVDRLIELDADINIPDELGQLPAHLAAKNNKFETLKTLLMAQKRKGNLEECLQAQDSLGMTVVGIAAKSDADRCLKVLQDFGADLEAPDIHGRTPMHIAAKHNAAGAFYQLYQLGASPYATIYKDNQDTGKTPAHSAARAGHLPIFKVLNIIAHDEAKQARANGNQNNTNCLEDLMDQPDMKGNKPIDIAQEHSHTHLVKFLNQVLFPW